MKTIKNNKIKTYYKNKHSRIKIETTREQEKNNKTNVKTGRKKYCAKFLQFIKLVHASLPRFNPWAEKNAFRFDTQGIIPGMNFLPACSSN
jgi:hypothetical protein